MSLFLLRNIGKLLQVRGQLERFFPVWLKRPTSSCSTHVMEAVHAITLRFARLGSIRYPETVRKFLLSHAPEVEASHERPTIEAEKPSKAGPCRAGELRQLTVKASPGDGVRDDKSRRPPW